MTDERDDRPADGLDRLRAANPVPDPTVFDPSAARARAIRNEVTMSSTTPTDPSTTDVSTTGDASPAPPWWRRPAVAGAAAALVLVVGIGAVLAGGGDGSSDEDDLAAVPGSPVTDDDVAAIDPGLFPDGDPATGSDPGGDGSQVTSCAVQFSPETLVEREYAFQGEVLTVAEDGTTTFRVDRWFAGGDSAEVTLDGSAMAGALLDPQTPFGPGAPVLIAGDGGSVWTCGFTQLADEFNTPVWEQAFS